MRRIADATWIPLAVFTLLLLHGALLGLTDDEAYYWVLAQKPALGYAFHPPMVAWLIGAAEAVFRLAHPAVVRFPAALSAALALWAALRWMEEVGFPGGLRTPVRSAAVVVLSFTGFFGLAWMMVPDLPLYAGWTFLFWRVYRVCFREEEPDSLEWLGIAGATAFALLCKYSAVLAAGSAVLSLWFWAPRHRRIRGIVSILGGGLLAATPILIWNAQHEWGSLLYQFRDRHQGGTLSLARYGRFWLSQLLLAGPVAVAYGLGLFFRSRLRFKRRIGTPAERVLSYSVLWALPAAGIFCVQPLWADFKPHWALVAWWPVLLALAWSFASGRDRRKAGFQGIFGVLLSALVLVSCHLPVASWIVEASTGKYDPRWDVTNDLYGWPKLKGFLRERLPQGELKPVIVGSRYQTASQASFALSGFAKVTLLPRDLKARDEWPDLGVSESHGPEWPKLTGTIYYVADNRYDQAPEFPGARCEKLGRLETSRGRFPAKWIDAWRCEP